MHLVGVAMKDNAASYQQSIQLETKLRELEAERQILQQQRDIANKEREKIVMESVSHKVSSIAALHSNSHTSLTVTLQCCMATVTFSQVQ